MRLLQVPTLVIFALILTGCVPSIFPSTISKARPETATQGPCPTPPDLTGGTSAEVQSLILSYAQSLANCSDTKVESEAQWERIVTAFEQATRT